MDVAAFVLSILALLFALLGLGLSMRALYIIGVNSGLQNLKKIRKKPQSNAKKIYSKKPIRTEGEKIIYNEDPLVYVIENFISDEECEHIKNVSDGNLERAKTIGGKDGIYHLNRTGSNCWIAHSHSNITTNLGQRIADLVGFPLKNAESFQVVYYTGGTEYNDHHDAFNADTDEGKKHLKRGGQRIYTALGYLNDVEEEVLQSFLI